MINFEEAVKIVRNNIEKGWFILFGCGDENCYIFVTTPHDNYNLWTDVGCLLFFVKDSKRYGAIPNGTDTSSTFSDIPKDTFDKIRNTFIKVVNPEDPDIKFVDTTYDILMGK